MKFKVFYTAYHYIMLNGMDDCCCYRQALRYLVLNNSLTYLRTTNTDLIKYEVSKSH